MKVVAFNGSPRAQGNTRRGLEMVLAELEKEGIQTEIIQLGGKKVFGCLACGQCKINKNLRCARNDDDMNAFIAKMFEADGIIIGSPTYFSNVNAEVKALIDRAGMVARANDHALKGKVGAPLVAARRAGATFVYSAINFFFGINQMIVPGSIYWNMTLGGAPGDIEKDEEGKNTFIQLGKNMADLLKKLN